MNTKKLDMDKIAKALGGERRGRVEAGAGYFGALQLAAEVQARFRVPAGGGRATDPNWTERRLVPLRPETLERLKELVRSFRHEGYVDLEPMHLAALLLEKAARQTSSKDARELLRKRKAG